MKLVGLWWNPAKSGEGFAFTEDIDPETGEQRLVGYYYTYIGETPVWYMLDLRRENDGTLSGDVIATSAEAGSEPGSPGKVIEERVDGCTLTARGDGTWNISVTINTKSVDYQIGSLFGTGLPAWIPDAEPEPDPPPDPDPPTEPDPEIPPNPFEGKLTFRVKGFKAPQFFPGQFYFNETDGKWYALWSTAQILWTQMHAGRNTTLELEITALEPISFLHTSGASGYGNPSIEGLPSSMSVGDEAIVQFKVDKTAARPSPAKDANFQINTSLGTLVLYTAHIMGGQ